MLDCDDQYSSVHKDDREAGETWNKGDLDHPN